MSSTSIQTRSASRPVDALHTSKELRSYLAADGQVAPAPKREPGIYTSTSHARNVSSDSTSSVEHHGLDGGSGRASSSSDPAAGSGVDQRRIDTAASRSSQKKAKAPSKFASFFSSSSSSSPPSPSFSSKSLPKGKSTSSGRRKSRLRAPATGHIPEDGDEETDEEEEEEEEQQASLDRTRELRKEQARNVQRMEEAQAAALLRAEEASDGLDKKASSSQLRGRPVGSPSSSTFSDPNRQGERRARSHSPGKKAPFGLPNVPLPNFQLPSNLAQKLSLPQFQIPVKDFPLQGNGKESEFDQAAPVWAKHPYKYLYFAYFGLSVGLYHLPAWSITSAVRSKRGRRDWSWKRATMVKLFRHGTKLTFRTHTSLGRDLTKEVPHSKTVKSKFVWVDQLEAHEIKGELQRAMKIQKIKATRTCGFWYGESGEGGVGQKAAPGEKVMYHLHGGAYWIGTAHESDVTAAVNTQALRYMNEIYESRKFSDMSPTNSRSSGSSGGDGVGVASPSSSSRSSRRSDRKGPKVSTTDYSEPGSKSGKLLRSFSLDYRLCVPGKPKSGSYPAALLDALAGYKYLVETCGFDPDDVVIAGDSAGGNLGIALCRYLRDEGVFGMPGSLLLMSPWADCSRSHAGPTGAPNVMSTAYTNIKSDIISPCLAFRNTAVSAFLGALPARETYRNPYLSSNSLQLPPHKGGRGPFWGFEGFPKRIYITTGSAEISYDQHLTLAHRMAAGTKMGRPIYAGDRISEGQDPDQLAGRYDYPRPKGLKVSLSSATTPGSTPGTEGGVRGRSGEGQEQQQERRAASEVFSKNERDPDGQPEASIEELNSKAGLVLQRSRSSNRQEGVEAGDREREAGAASPLSLSSLSSSSRTLGQRVGAGGLSRERLDETMLPSQRQKEMDEKQTRCQVGRTRTGVWLDGLDGGAARDGGNAELSRDAERQAEEMVKVRRGPEEYGARASAGGVDATDGRRRDEEGRRSGREEEAEGGKGGQRAGEVIKAQDFIGESDEQARDEAGERPSTRKPPVRRPERPRPRRSSDDDDDDDGASLATPEIRVSPPDSDTEGAISHRAEQESYFVPRGPRRRAYSEDSPLTPWSAASRPDADGDGEGEGGDLAGRIGANRSAMTSLWSLESGVSRYDEGAEGEEPSLRHKELEERVVVLDEVKDAIHDYLLFSWFEPERSGTWRRIARWVDGA